MRLDNSLLCFHIYVGNRDVIPSEEIKISETITRMSEVIAAQRQPVSLVVTGEDLSNIVIFIG